MTDVPESLPSSTGALAIQVQGTADGASALRGLQAARRDISALLAGSSDDDSSFAGPRVSPATGAPGGPLLVLNNLADPRPEALPGVFDLITRRLEQAGLRGASLATLPVGGPLAELGQVPHAVVLRIFPPPAGPDGVVPQAWLEAATDWLADGLGDLDLLRLRLLDVELDVKPGAAQLALAEATEARAWCDLVRGDLDDRIQTVSLSFGSLPHLAVATGGPGVTEAGLLERYATLCDLARELAAALAYACISFEADFEGMSTGLGHTIGGQSWSDTGGAPLNGVAAWLLDDRVPDAYPFQVLGPAHLALLSAKQVGQVPGAVPLSDGRSELTVGAPEAWLASSRDRQATRAKGLLLLDPLLVPDDEFDKLVGERFGSGGLADELVGATHGASSSSTVGESPDAPDLTVVTLDAHAHARRSNRLTLLELVAWLAGEPHGEEPRSVSRPLATFARWWASGLDDVSRQALITRAPALVASGTTEAIEAERRWGITEWLVRTEASSWLRAAGLTESADRLTELGQLDAEPTLIDAVDLLTRAATVASVRLQLTLDMAVAGLPPDDEDEAREALEAAAWDAWEQVQEHVAWVAAAEASIHDDPGELGTTADQRVIDHCRTATELETTTSMASLIDDLWSLVTAALVAGAWEQGWIAADSVAGSAANTDLSGAALSGEVPAWEQLVAGDRATATLHAEEAAHAVLLQVARSYAAGEEPSQAAWDLALEAAREAPGTEAWQAAIDDVRHRAGEPAWDLAMASARSRVAQTLLRSADLLGRVALVATAREAAGAAARVVAARGAAVAAANGGNEDLISAGAVDALRPLAGDLARSALGLLDRLLGYTDPDFAITSATFGGTQPSGDLAS